MYQPIDPDGGCVSTNFDQNEMIACPNSRYVFSDSVPYAFSLVEELGLPPCKTGDWPLKVSQTRIYLTKKANFSSIPGRSLSN